MKWQKVRKNLLLKDAVVAFSVAILIWIILFQSIQREYQGDIENHLHETINNQNMSWLAATKMFQRGAQARFQASIYQPEVLDLLEKALDPQQTQQARLELYRLLYPYYQQRLLLNSGHFHLHFHTPDNRSFLRFHQPDKFGDDLSDARPTIVKANQTLKPVFAFESGKVISGLRHVFPIIYKGKHLGSVEFGQKFESLRKEIALFNPQHEYTIIYQATPLKAKQFKQFAYLYAPSQFSADWLEEDPFRLLPQTPLPLSQNFHQIAKQASADTALKQALANGENYANTYLWNKSYFILAFTTIKDVNNQTMAYLVSLKQTDNITTHHERVSDFNAILTLIMVLVALGLWRILISRRNEIHRKSYLESINNTMSEGLYVADNNGLITTANVAAQKMLGYSENELMGQNAHKLFHKANAEKSAATRCPIEMAAKHKKAFHGELMFRTKQQEPVMVSVSSRPLFVNQLQEGAVVSFTNITEQKTQDEALRIAATAFETQEGIMITDPKGTILRVNQAFTRLTGYHQKEVIGKKPNILSSGRQDKDYYRHMWQSLYKDHFWQGEIWNRRKDGRVYLEWLTITAVLNKKNHITHFVANFSDVTERHHAQEEIQQLAFFDPLTKLPNRRLLLDRLDHALLNSQRNHQCGALFFIDLDNFKTLNDSKGHMTGDLLLIEVANRLTRSVREVDTVSRIGGDEFVILMENLGENIDKASHQAEEVALKILEVFRQPFKLKDALHHTSPSIGVEVINCKHMHSDEILMHADLAMYQAKKHGRNTVRFFDPQMQISVEKIANLQNDLRNAIENQEFELYYQPQVNQHAQIIYAEALIRWNHDERGFVSPAEFIPLAEDSGLIIPIGDWVLKSACETLVNWQSDPALSHIKLAVNVSAKQFAEKAFVNKVKQILMETGATPDNLKLELTESMILNNIEKTIDKMNSLRDIGVRFSMDDFGTGHSSLAYLKRLPLSQLKIDQSFIRDLEVDSDDAAIVKTIIAMSNTLKLEVIAEGVETFAQKEFLRENQCFVYQGYLFSRPLPKIEFENLVNTAQNINNLDF